MENRFSNNSPTLGDIVRTSSKPSTWRPSDLAKILPTPTPVKHKLAVVSSRLFHYCTTSKPSKVSPRTSDGTIVCTTARQLWARIQQIPRAEERRRGRKREVAIRKVCSRCLETLILRPGQSDISKLKNDHVEKLHTQFRHRFFF